VRKKERERELLFLFLKGMTGALAPFSFLFFNKNKVTNSILFLSLQVNGLDRLKERVSDELVNW
jgi:hypothetical protein